jgi:serine/threonine protein kinase/tetratricopeptide (TPR) repeat protein
MIGKTVSHYKILEELGRGGMGVVHKAEDTKLGRTVALKFLPPGFTGDAEARERFIHEARAAAVLNHNNICTIHEIDEADGRYFIAMELIEGESLRERIAGGPLPVDEAIEFARQIAAGLEKAHQRGIVHRDIKSANIMITPDGQVKIMDFGLAKSHGATKLTKEDTTLGTIQYMSPEQSQGGVMDHRSDIWSVGVVLFEMVTGQCPFKGDYDQAVVYSILNEEPEAMTGLRTGVPLELERIVNKCLEKDPAERYQTASGFIADLKHLSRIRSEDESTGHSTLQPPPPPEHRAATQKITPGISAKRRLSWLPWLVVIAVAAALAIIITPRFLVESEKPAEEYPASRLTMLAVLPFHNLGPTEDDYFADGITDAITARLAGLSGLGIISRQSAIQYKNGGKSTRQISEELGVDYILEGTIQRERPSDPSSRVRIIPQLIRCADDVHLWADTYDEDMTEVFRLQSEIAERVAHELDVTLLEPERRALAAKPTENIEAYEYFLRGIEHSKRRSIVKETTMAIEMFKMAVELDPGFAIAWALLSRAYTWSFWMMADQDGLAKARAAADEAMRIDPDLPEGHLSLGFICYYGSRDYNRALEHFFRVHKQRPGDAEVNDAIGLIKRRQGKWDEALMYFERAIKMNPRSHIMHWDNFGMTYYMLRRYDEAEGYIDRAISLEPDMPTPYFLKAAIAISRDGDLKMAKQYMEKSVERIPPNDLWMMANLFQSSIMRICYDSPCDEIDKISHKFNAPANSLVSAIFYTARARCSLWRKNDQEAAALLDSARVILERVPQRGVQIISFRSIQLGLVYAYLGRKEDAIREGEKAVELLPISKDAFEGPSGMISLAEIYTIVGEYEAAIDQLEVLLSTPCEFSAQEIRLDPIWDPLRDHPRFKRLLDKYLGN